jgi:hypothetical protein
MTKAEGGTVFTYCEVCWNKHNLPPKPIDEPVKNIHKPYPEMPSEKWDKQTTQPCLSYEELKNVIKDLVYNKGLGINMPDNSSGEEVIAQAIYDAQMKKVNE